MRQNPVGEPAGTAALNFARTAPQFREAMGPFCHCRQSTFVAFGGSMPPVGEAPAGLAEAKVSTPSQEVWPPAL